MSTLDQVLAHAKKLHGANIGDYGTHLPQTTRLPSGFWEFDIATGGGWPRGKFVEVYGPESSGKTNLMLKTIATFQKLYPHLKCVFADIEHAVDGAWARKLGVDTDKLIILRPEYVEQIVDFVEGALAATDCGLVVLDSLAAMITFNEAIKDASVAAVGGSSALVGKMMRKITLRLTQAEKEGRFPTVLAVNQIRFKVGTGPKQNPETTPGGNAPRFAAAMRVRTYGSEVEVAKVSTVLPALKQTDFIIRKNKCPIISKNGMYQMVTIAHDGMAIGETNETNSVLGYLKKTGLIVKGPKASTWVLDGVTYKTLEPVREKLANDKVWGFGIKAKMIDLMLAGGEIEGDNDNAAEDTVAA